jgi:two-component system chemotaxis response regulator CheB
VIRVLVVDDSAVVRHMLHALLGGEADMTVVGMAGDPFEARELIVATRPDVITLDIQMPRMDGLSFLRRLMTYHPLPVVILSSVAPENSDSAMLALELGAIEVVGKPKGDTDGAQFRRVLTTAVRAAARARLMPLPRTGPKPAVPRQARSLGPDLVAIGASTGGIRAIEAILQQFPADAPPCLIVQHLPPQFTSSFAARLDTLSRMTVREARHGERLGTGVALVAPGDRHMLVVGDEGGYTIRLSDAPRVHHQRPAVDVLFDSVAAMAGPRAAAALLTGMGSDGARGLLRIREEGGFTVAESEETCVVYGMPRKAVDLDAASRVAPLQDIAAALLGGLHRGRRGPDLSTATTGGGTDSDSSPPGSGRY